ncbi:MULTISPECIES: GGDEF domain-containing protein [Thalassospira]|uniref:GGDEF domain-containing protein n=2 Tax=Thalassospiraceae TaxID=2844866 RepID=UPI0008DDF8EB|nr:MULTISPECIES: GGDEF domain-containing protein [Thalassospira]MAB33499.1 GGDEF domain-containing protein [Thalassospira sp.]MDM7978573.1 GGDEF domain-containing protein [Thalassospira xiamenensis]OHZ01750.1 diguanylate cyclase [Thalassospira sp. MIT1004]
MRCRYRDFLYTPRHAELLHLRRKESVQLTARFAAFFTLVLLALVPIWDGAYGNGFWQSQAVIMRLLVMGIAVVVLLNRAVSSKWRRRAPYLPMLFLVIAAALLCGFSGLDLAASPKMLTSHSFLLLGIVVLIAIMPLTLAEAGIMVSPIVVLLFFGAQGPVAGGYVPVEMILPVLLPLAVMAAMVQLYRTIVAAQEIAIDPLTGVYTRAFGMEMLRLNFEAAYRKRSPLTVAFVDLDDFKKINDQFGHDYGDRILEEAGRNLAHRFRSTDLVIRWGGEEFLVILPDLTLARANEVMHRVMAPGLADLANGLTQQASYGLAERIEDVISQPHNLIDLADQRMYDAKKRHDREQIVADGLSGRKISGAAATTSSARAADASKVVNQTLN